MSTDRSDWPEALATVSSCEYDMRAGRALAFGLPSSQHFRIAYTYEVDGAVHEGQCFSKTAMPQGTVFPLRYNPEQPKETTQASANASARGSLIGFGILGSIVLSALWLLLTKGCR